MKRSNRIRLLQAHNEAGHAVRLMKLTIVLLFTYLSTAAVYAESYNYSCKVCIFPSVAGDGYDGCEVDGKTYPLRVDDNKNVLEWRGKMCMKSLRTSLLSPRATCSPGYR